MSIRFLALAAWLLSAAAAPAIAQTSDEGSHRWAVHVDDDLFAFTDHDRDYTAGLTFALTGGSAREHRLSLSPLLDRLDRALRVGAPRGDFERAGDALEMGLLLFTPQNLAATEALHDDRPYASLVYLASSTLEVDEANGTAVQSSLALGFLGSPLAGELHRGFHRAVGNEVPQGYAHQISAGGEPTFLYVSSRYKLLADGHFGARPYSLRLGVSASVGYVTETNFELALRTDTPWWSASAAAVDYAGHPQIGAEPLRAPRGRPRVQLEAGLKIHARLYNAFLEGQFRHSDVTFRSSELQPLLVDAWLGATAALARGLSVSYAVHHQTEEIETGRDAHAFTWASIGVARRF
jgi:hypothetical protein